MRPKTIQGERVERTESNNKCSFQQQCIRETLLFLKVRQGFGDQAMCCLTCSLAVGWGKPAVGDPLP